MEYSNGSMLVAETQLPIYYVQGEYICTQQIKKYEKNMIFSYIYIAHLFLILVKPILSFVVGSRYKQEADIYYMSAPCFKCLGQNLTRNQIKRIIKNMNKTFGTVEYSS